MADLEQTLPNGDVEEVTAQADADMAELKDIDTPMKKRRRSIKPNLDKKFECKHEGCGKSYSRAEHLYRHQLNHTPKTIYRCDFPDCNRYFVRQDLCVRHRERHTTHGSQLHKRDNFSQPSDSIDGTSALYTVDASGMTIGAQYGYETGDQPQYDEKLDDASQHGMHQYPSPETVHRTRISGSATSYSTASTDPRLQPPTPQASNIAPEVILHRSNSSSSNTFSPNQQQEFTFRKPPNRHDTAQNRSNDRTNTMIPRENGHQEHELSHTRSHSMSSTSTNQPFPYTSKSYQQSTMLSSNDFASHAAMQSGSHDPQAYQYSTLHTTPQSFVTAVSQGFGEMRNGEDLAYPSMANAMNNFELGNPYGMTVFGSDDLNRTTFSMGDDFTSWLFNDNQASMTGLSSSVFMPGLTDSPSGPIQGPYFNTSPQSLNNPTTSTPMQHPMSVTSILDASNNSNYIMSEDKRQELLHILEVQFVERPHDAVKKRKDSVFEGNINGDDHILSLRMMHTYIASYWYHQHAQLPILHKPTFSADKTPNLLLLSVLAIGAATMDKAYGTSLTDSAAEFANFVAWHIRWEIMRDADFRPPAKLWIFQTLLLIEVYEKMYATRALHERSHIHHDTTLTLMRRGSSLLGRSASDSPPSLSDPHGNKTEGRRANGNGNGNDSRKSEDSWTRWIATEATRRCAFGAFLMDSLHATMFGHAAKMVAHEMRLPLPCDEGLWSAISPAEASRVQSSLQTNGVRPTMFLEALKKTLNGERVRTNSFGRMVIMAGLLSVSWHMSQRDVQISSLGSRTVQTFGGPDKWKGALLCAFDNWKRDFDEAIAETATLHPPSSPSNARPEGVSRSNSFTGGTILRPVDDENIFESRTVLHHLAHIAAHVDVVDCQVFAGANRLLGRAVTPKDYSIIKEKITERWATRASARDAAFYALKFIAQVLVPGDYDGKGWRYGHASPILPQAFDDRDMYIARDDFLLNRPWVLYVSTLVVWSYGFALEGPIQPQPRDEDFDTYEKKDKDMRKYLERVAGVHAPDDLEHVRGKNRCLGMMMLLQESFLQTRWELTREAAGLLGNCVMKLMGKTEGEEERMAGG